MLAREFQMHLASAAQAPPTHLRNPLPAVSFCSVTAIRMGLAHSCLVSQAEFKGTCCQ